MAPECNVNKDCEFMPGVLTWRAIRRRAPCGYRFILTGLTEWIPGLLAIA